jgi:hypothetical protein
MRQNSLAIFAFALTALAVVQYARAQTASPTGSGLPPQQISPQAAPTANADAGADTRFGELRKVADQYRVTFEKLDGDNMAEIDTLMRSKRCQITHVDGLLDRVVASLELWNDAELKYWVSWGDAEADRVEGQQKSLAGMEGDQKRAEELVLSTQKDRESLLRDKANLEKFGARTEAIRKQIDSLIQDIKESESRLAEAQKTYDETSIKVRNMQASINARLIDIRQNKQRVEAYVLEMKSYYEKTRQAANEVIKMAQPKPHTSLPKTRAATPAQCSAC